MWIVSVCVRLRIEGARKNCDEHHTSPTMFFPHRCYSIKSWHVCAHTYDFSVPSASQLTQDDSRSYHDMTESARQMLSQTNWKRMKRTQTFSHDRKCSHKERAKKEKKEKRNEFHRWSHRILSAMKRGQDKRRDIIKYFSISCCV